MRTALTLLLLAAAGPVVGQEKSWKGEKVMHTKPSKDIQFGDMIDGKQVYFKFSGRLPIAVRDDRDGWLRIHDGYREGWVDKTDFVLEKEAPGYFHRRVQADPNDWWALHMRGEGWLGKGEFDNAIKDFNECIRLDPNSSSVYNSRGVAWRDKKDYDKAIADYNEAIRLDPNGPMAYCNRGSAWRDKKDYDKAIADYDEAIRLDPNDGYIFNNRGIAWAGKKNYDKAIADFNEAVRLDPKFAWAYNNRGIAWAGKKDYEKAIADYNEAIRLDPIYTFAYNNRAAVWFNKRDYEKAIADYNEAIRLDPKYVVAYRSRGVVWRAKKEYDRAIADYNEAIRLDPKDAANLNSLAWLLATCPDAKVRDGKRAVELAFKGAAVDKSANMMDTVAAAYAEAGNFEEAVRWQQRAVDAEKNDDFRSRLELYRKKQPYREK
jgi:tetratricopeptide (TPR) repeat protein